MSGTDPLHGRGVLGALGIGAMAAAVPFGLAAAWLVRADPHMRDAAEAALATIGEK